MSAVRRSNDHCVPVDANPIGAQAEAIDLRAQDVQVHEAAGWYEKAGLWSHEARRKLAYQNHFAGLILERVPGVGPTAANAQVDVLLQRDDRGDFAFAF